MKVYSMSELARAAGYSPSWIHHAIYTFRTIPEPDIAVGKKNVYSHKIYKEALEMIPPNPGRGRKRKIRLLK